MRGRAPNIRKGIGQAGQAISKAPGALYNAYQKAKLSLGVKKAFKKKKKSGLRPADVVVADEQRSSHQYYKGKKKKTKQKMTNIGLIKKGNGGKTNIGVMRQTGKQTEARKKTTKKKMCMKSHKHTKMCMK